MNRDPRPVRFLGLCLLLSIAASAAATVVGAVFVLAALPLWSLLQYAGPALGTPPDLATVWAWLVCIGALGAVLAMWPERNDVAADEAPARPAPKTCTSDIVHHPLFPN